MFQSQVIQNHYLRLPTEPGYYADGKWGIRIENVVIVREVQTPNNFGKNGYIGFERVTMVGLIFDAIAFGALMDVGMTVSYSD